MKLAFILTHNKSNKENFNQIEFLKSNIIKIIDTYNVFNDNGKKEGVVENYHYEINDLGLPHEAIFFQIIPFGINLPVNLYAIDSHKVFYGNGDADKQGEHARFFNWGLKRATDYGADIVIHIDNYKNFDFKTLPFYINTLIDPFNKVEFVIGQSEKISTLNFQKQIGKLNELKTTNEAIDEILTKIDKTKMEIING